MQVAFVHVRFRIKVEAGVLKRFEEGAFEENEACLFAYVT